MEEFIALSKQGLLFYGQTKQQLKTLLQEMVDANDFQKTIYLFRLIEILINTKEYKLLSSSSYVNTYVSKDNDVIDRIFRHVFNNYQNEITLDEVAQIANLTKTAFCRYFRSRTQKKHLYSSSTRFG